MRGACLSWRTRFDCNQMRRVLRFWFGLEELGERERFDTFVGGELRAKQLAVKEYKSNLYSGRWIKVLFTHHLLFGASAFPLKIIIQRGPL